MIRQAARPTSLLRRRPRLLSLSTEKLMKRQTPMLQQSVRQTQMSSIMQEQDNSPGGSRSEVTEESDFSVLAKGTVRAGSENSRHVPYSTTPLAKRSWAALTSGVGDGGWSSR